MSRCAVRTLRDPGSATRVALLQNVSRTTTPQRFSPHTGTSFRITARGVAKIGLSTSGLCSSQAEIMGGTNGRAATIRRSRVVRWPGQLHTAS